MKQIMAVIAIEGKVIGNSILRTFLLQTLILRVFIM